MLMVLGSTKRLLEDVYRLINFPLRFTLISIISSQLQWKGVLDVRMSSKCVDIARAGMNNRVNKRTTA